MMLGGQGLGLFWQGSPLDPVERRGRAGPGWAQSLRSSSSLSRVIWADGEVLTRSHTLYLCQAPHPFQMIPAVTRPAAVHTTGAPSSQSIRSS